MRRCLLAGPCLVKPEPAPYLQVPRRCTSRQVVPGLHTLGSLHAAEGTWQAWVFLSVCAMIWHSDGGLSSVCLNCQYLLGLMSLMRTHASAVLVQALSASRPPYQRPLPPPSPFAVGCVGPSGVLPSNTPVNHSVPATGVDEAVMRANPGRKFGDCLMEVDSGAGWVHAVAWSPSGQLLQH